MIYLDPQESMIIFFPKVEGKIPPLSYGDSLISPDTVTCLPCLLVLVVSVPSDTCMLTIISLIPSLVKNVLDLRMRIYL